MKVLILGAASGIARAVIRMLAEQGADLFLVARNVEALCALVDDARVRGAGRIGDRVLDLNETAQHEDLIREADSFLEGIDVALIAHGTLGDQQRGEQDWTYVAQEIQTNFTSQASLMTELARLMEPKGKGTIAVITSVAGDRGRQSNYIYGSAKAGASAFAQGMRNRLYHKGVHALTIKPGFVATPMTAHLKQGPLFASPERVAKGILKAIRKKRNVVYLPWFWRYILLIVKLLPESIFKRLRT